MNTLILYFLKREPSTIPVVLQTLKERTREKERKKLYDDDGKQKKLALVLRREKRAWASLDCGM